MALGGGTFTFQNKVLPGTYINFVSAASASASLSDRGIAAMPLETDWGPEGDIFEVTSGDFIKNSLTIFGYDYTNEKMKGLRDLFIGAKILYAYRLNGGGTKATNTFATAKFGGTRGNDLKIVITANADDNTKWDVSTLLDTEVMDTQVKVADAAALVANDWVTFKSDATLAATAGTALTGGTNVTVTGTQHQTFLDKLEAYSFNTLGLPSTDATTKSLYVAYTQRMRDEIGKKFQLVVHSKAADNYGVINVKNSTSDANWNDASLVYWVTGMSAGCEVNASLHNRLYNGEFTVGVSYTQAQLETAIQSGEFTFHKVGADVRVLEDINSMVTTSDTQGDVFKDNQTVRVIDQIANDIAVIFNTQYLGVVPNDSIGRTSLRSDIISHHQQLADIRAIEDFSAEDVKVEQGENKHAVVVTDAITVVNTMLQLYMTVTVG